MIATLTLSSLLFSPMALAPTAAELAPVAIVQEPVQEPGDKPKTGDEPKKRGKNGDRPKKGERKRKEGDRPKKGERKRKKGGNGERPPHKRGKKGERPGKRKDPERPDRPSQI